MIAQPEQAGGALGAGFAQVVVNVGRKDDGLVVHVERVICVVQLHVLLARVQHAPVASVAISVCRISFCFEIS